MRVSRPRETAQAERTTNDSRYLCVLKIPNAAGFAAQVIYPTVGLLWEAATGRWQAGSAGGRTASSTVKRGAEKWSPRVLQLHFERVERDWGKAFTRLAPNGEPHLRPTLESRFWRDGFPATEEARGRSPAADTFLWRH